ncbi:helix-turn-helix domain-containing protein [Frankia sp. ACN1ag]|uniref:helix-turn-helix domain-containing protein n=1 Tax=Frankia sp. ACN1ag TaxID=102891 RepID=UPI0006DC5482|nr:helix-turn-helix domain-containing protein [Frankia sp. ACN1ag]KQC39253.1 hypothetical protein UK82_06335 [Frankia sp. ACN1ag]
MARRGAASASAGRKAAPRTGPFLTVDEVAERLRTTAQALYMMRHRGGGPPAVQIGRKLLYAESDLAAYIERMYAEQDGTA